MSELKDRIFDLIANGEFTGGHWLREETLAKRLGVSRTPVRGGLKELASSGVVKIVPNRGAQVVEYSETDIEEIYLARAHIEPDVVASAIPQLTESEIDDLRQLARHMEALTGSSENRTEISRYNNEFHLTFIDAAANQALARAARDLLTPLLVARNFLAYSESVLDRSMRHHEELVLAAETRNPQWAHAVMRAHILSGLHGFRQSTQSGGDD